MDAILIYIRLGLTFAIVIIPSALGLYYLSNKVVDYLTKKIRLMRETSELKNMKVELQQQKGDFITSNEYGVYVSPEENLVPSEKDEQPMEEQEEKNILDSKIPTDQKKDLSSNSLNTSSEENENKIYLEKEKKKITTLLLEASLLKNEGKLEQYEKKLIEGLAIKEDLSIIKPLSELYFTLGNYKKALPLLKKVTELDPSDHKGIWQIGEIYFMTGDNQTSELLVEKAIALKNDNPKYYLTMVEIYYNTERYTEALAYMEKIIKLRPTNPKYLLAIAELYEQVDDLDNAKKYYFYVLEYEQNNEKAKLKIKELTQDIS